MINLNAHSQCGILNTNYNANNGQDGIMFDIYAVNGVEITNFSMDLDVGVHDVEIYTKTGSHVGFEGNAAAWTLLGTANAVNVTGSGFGTVIPLTISVIIPGCETAAFYVTTTGSTFSGSNYTNGTAVGNVWAADANLQILEGTGKDHAFAASYSPRNPNINVTYNCVNISTCCPSPNMTFSSTTCAGACDGTATATIGTTGSPPYTYQWDVNAGSQTTQTATGLCAGTYDVSVTDNNGCTSFGTVTVTDGATSANATINPVGPFCETANAINLTAADPGGTWSGNGITDPVLGTFDPTIALPGTHTITYSIAGICGDTDTEDIIVYALPSVSAGATQTVCDGSSVTLSGSGAVSYTWDNGVTDGVAFTPALGTTTYTVTGTDANNCINTNQVDVNVNPLPSVNAGTDQIICNDGTTVVLTGSGALNYTWDNGVTDGVPFIPALGSTTYTVTGTDANNCANSDQVAVLVNALPNVDAGIDQTVCINSSITLSGNGAVSYSWDNGVTDGVPFTISSPTMFTVTGTDANNCTNTDVVNISISDPAFVDNVVQSTCGNPDGEISLTASNGVPNYQYSIDGGTTFQSTGLFTGLLAGTYIIVVEDAIGCQITGQVNVTDQGGPIINSSLGTDELCIGSCDGTIVINATGANLFSIDNGTTFQTLNSFNNLCTGTYDIIVEDNFGCQAIDQVVINQPTLLTSNVISTDLDCFGVCIGEINISAQGGTAPYQFSIDDGVSFQAANTFSNLCQGVYDAVIQDANGCQTLGQNVFINEPPELTMLLGVTDESCAGACDGMINSIPTGGTGAGTYNYNWTPAAGNLPLITNLCTGNYSLTVTDANGCTVSSNEVINGPPAVVINNVTVTDELCNGDCSGVIDINASGATLYSVDGVNFQTNNVFSNLCANNYTVYVEDVNGCSASSPVIVSSPAPVILQPFTNSTICIGSSVQIQALCNGGTGVYTYLWDNGASTQTINVSPTSNQIYCVTATDQNGCVSNNECVTITVNPPLSVQAMGDQTICNGQSASISATGSGGDGGPYTYTWDQGIGAGQNHTVSPTSSTVYTVVLTDGCGTPGDTASINIIVSPMPNISFTGNILSGCNPLEVTFTESNVPAGSQCVWSFGDGGSSNNCGPIDYTFITQGCWDVTLDITTIDGCIGTHTEPQYICVYDNPIADFSFGPQPTTILNSDIDFTNTSSGGLNFIWNIGALQFFTEDLFYTFEDTGSFDVQLIAIGDGGCIDSITYPVIIGPDLLVYVPNAITINGDGINDEFLPSVMGHEEASYQLYIFDRWGNIIYESQHANQGWDGKQNNEYVKTGVYVWKIILRAKATQFEKEFVGHVTVLK